MEDDFIKTYFTAPNQIIEQLNASKNQNNDVKFYIMQLMSKIKKCVVIKKNERFLLYWKHDINNGILSYMQLNENLHENIYKKISEIRELLWINDSEYIQTDEFISMLNKVFDTD